ncbi:MULTISPECIES: transposase [Cohnella]|uniref:transposase n=1 Tax=Cohnella TaxID=329857 RepID=UPI0009BAFA1E|nr:MULTISPECIES: transposase [Cohnella]MBN2980563.1 transposase [Cohnella algarum]MBN2981713.1 transposase [Cohnella algarum]
MGGQRVHYNEEFKQRTVRYIQEQTKTVVQIAQELDIPEKTLYGWVAKYRQFEVEPVNSADRIRELEWLLREKDKQVADLEQELEIIKKAVHIFSSPRK